MQRQKEKTYQECSMKTRLHTRMRRIRKHAMRETNSLSMRKTATIRTRTRKTSIDPEWELQQRKKEIFRHMIAERNVNMLFAVIMWLQNGADREKIPARFT